MTIGFMSLRPLSSTWFQSEGAVLNGPFVCVCVCKGEEARKIIHQDN